MSAHGVTLRAVAETQPERGAHTAWTYATNVVLLEDNGGLPGRAMPEVLDATDLLDQLGGDPERCLVAARSSCIAVARHVGAATAWRTGLRAVELGQRAECEGQLGARQPQLREVGDGEWPATTAPRHRPGPDQPRQPRSPHTRSMIARSRTWLIPKYPAARGRL